MIRSDISITIRMNVNEYAKQQGFFSQICSLWCVGSNFVTFVPIMVDMMFAFALLFSNVCI